MTAAPTLGFPNMTSFDSGICTPARSATPLWSMTLNTVKPRASITPRSRSMVCATDALLCVVTVVPFTSTLRGLPRDGGRPIDDAAEPGVDPAGDLLPVGRRHVQVR